MTRCLGMGAFKRAITSGGMTPDSSGLVKIRKSSISCGFNPSLSKELLAKAAGIAESALPVNLVALSATRATVLIAVFVNESGLFKIGSVPIISLTALTSVLGGWGGALRTILIFDVSSYSLTAVCFNSSNLFLVVSSNDRSFSVELVTSGGEVTAA